MIFRWRGGVADVHPVVVVVVVVINGLARPCRHIAKSVGVHQNSILLLRGVYMYTGLCMFFVRGRGEPVVGGLRVISADGLC